MRRIDTHAHVFHRALHMAPGARYRPTYDATLADYLALLDRHGVAGGVLVQPSFLGTDNGYLLRCLKAAGGRLRGIVVVEPTVPDEVLAEMDRAGVVGIRFNMIGLSPGLLAGQEVEGLLRRVARLGWQVEVHAEGAKLPTVLTCLGGFEGPIVVDHFGRPDAMPSTAWIQSSALLEAASTGEIHVKLSAPYRLARLDARATAARFVDALGPERLLWGSDWPWTQHESGRSYDALLPEVLGLSPGTEAEINRNAARLFRFADE